MHSSTKNTRSLFAAILAVVTVPTVYGQNSSSLSQTLSAAAYYARGDYGEADVTRIRYFPLSYEANKGKWGVQVLVPRLEVSGLGNVLVNVGGVTQAVAGGERTTQEGLGDMVLSAIYRFDSVFEVVPFIDFRLDVKVPLADERKSLGTGEVDYTPQLNLSRYLGNNLLFATVGHNFRGDSTLYPGLRDSSFLQVGTAFPVTDNWTAGVYYDYREAASDYGTETHEVVPYFTWQWSERWSLTGLAVWGATEGSADLSVLGQISYRW